MVSGEHFVLKDLPFYEEAHKADVTACQERLDQREEKRQERKLRRAPGEKSRASFFAACPPVKKKKPSAKAVKASALIPVSSSASTLSASTSTDSSVPASNGNLDLPDFE